jgi:hypothetical protein
MNDVSQITKRFELLEPILGEREVRMLAAAEAECIGCGGVTLVAHATGVSRRRIAEGIKELRREECLDKGRTRRERGGRMPAGQRIRCELDTTAYPKGTKISDKELATIKISKDNVHGEWNHTITPPSP